MKLLIINDFGVRGGGTENRISTLINYFIKNKIFREIHIIQQQNNERLQEKKDRGVKIHYSPKGHLKAYFFAKDIIKQYKIDFVQAHNMMALTPSPVLAAKSLGKPVVWYAHDYWAMCGLRNFINPYNAMNDKLCGKAYGSKCKKCRKSLKLSAKLWLWKKILNKADLAIATGKKMVELYGGDGILKGRWKVVIPWIDPSMLKRAGAVADGTEKRNKNILFVGSLIDFKGAWVAVKAMARIIEKVPDASLVFIGNGHETNSPSRKRIDAVAEQYNVTKNMKFLGEKNRKEIKKELQKAGAYVCPTVCMESFGLNWAEAMASGCPVIASRIGSIPDYISDKNKNGMLFEPRNHRELAGMIVSVLKDKQLSGNLGKVGRQYAAEHFDIEISGKEIVNLYKNMGLG